MKNLCFFLGTEAELIKVFPIMDEAKKSGISISVIASGQNNIANSRILESINIQEIDLELSKEKDIKKSALGLIRWWIKTYYGSFNILREFFEKKGNEETLIIVHGDTISTYMGACIGRKMGIRVCHIEAGLRSHNIFSPFPEEIDRLLTSKIADFHFAPGKEAVLNLSKVKGKVINTYQNTLIDSLRFSQTKPVTNEKVGRILNEDYFLFVMHRQENLIKQSFVRAVMDEIIQISEERTCVILLHKITENALRKWNILPQIDQHPNIITFPRIEYFDFMKILQNAKFVITDGGSNQEELYYMKKPSLILRKTTERNEGIGINARLYNGRPSDIRKFLEEYKSGKFYGEDFTADSPSKIIINELQNL